MSYSLYNSDKPNKKYKIVIRDDNNRSKTIYFGASGYEDYTIHKNDERKRRYIQRHSKREYWNNPRTPGFYSRWILWNKKTINASIKDVKKRFRINITNYSN